MVLERIRHRPFVWASSCWLGSVGLASGVVELLDAAPPKPLAVTGLAGSLLLLGGVATVVKVFFPVPPATPAPEAGATEAPQPEPEGPAAPAHRIPEIPTSFVARDDECSKVVQALSAARLVTLTGLGGSGKTRLALELARSLVASYDGRVHFVDFVSVEAPGRVAATVSRALHLRDSPQLPVLQTLVRALRGERTLLILDNCEHLLGGVRDLARELLAECPEVRILATSREPLHVAGEVVWPVAPLAVPGAGDDVAATMRTSAARLFVARVRELQPTFEVTDGNVGYVAEICRQVDGLPLAVEVAAARVRLLGPRTLTEQLGNQLKWRTMHSRPGRSEPETLGAVMAWSYDLLTAPQQALLRRLGIFAGSFDLPAIVACGTEWSDDEALSLLEKLVDSSLVVLLSTPDTTARYRLLAPMRAFAREHLEKAGELAVVAQRHAEFYARRAEVASVDMTSRRRGGALAAIDGDYPELQAALLWTTTDDRDPATAVRIAGALFWYWNFRGFLTPGHDWYAIVTAYTGRAETAAGARMLYGAGGIAFLVGQLDVARAHLVRSVATWTEVGDPRGKAYAQVILGMVELYRGEKDAALAHERSAVALFRQEGDQWGLALAYNDLGNVMAARDEPAAAISLYEQSLLLWRAVDDSWGMSLTLTNLAASACQDGDQPRAQRLIEQALRIQDANDDRWGRAWSLMALADVACAMHDLDKAQSLYSRSLTLHLDIGRLQIAGDCLMGLAEVSKSRQRPRATAVLLGAAAALRERLGVRAGIPQRRNLESRIAEFQEHLADPELHEMFDCGRRLTVEQAVRAANDEMEDPRR